MPQNKPASDTFMQRTFGSCMNCQHSHRHMQTKNVSLVIINVLQVCSQLCHAVWALALKRVCSRALLHQHSFSQPSTPLPPPQRCLQNDVAAASERRARQWSRKSVRMVRNQSDRLRTMCHTGGTSRNKKMGRKSCSCIEGKLTHVTLFGKREKRPFSEFGIELGRPKDCHARDVPVPQSSCGKGTTEGLPPSLTCTWHIPLFLFSLEQLPSPTAGLKLDLKVIELNIPQLCRETRLQIQHSCSSVKSLHINGSSFTDCPYTQAAPWTDMDAEGPQLHLSQAPPQPSYLFQQIFFWLSLYYWCEQHKAIHPSQANHAYLTNGS